jgi:hypothetical protein
MKQDKVPVPFNGTLYWVDRWGAIFVKDADGQLVPASGLSKEDELSIREDAEMLR